MKREADKQRSDFDFKADDWGIPQVTAASTENSSSMSNSKTFDTVFWSF